MSPLGRFEAHWWISQLRQACPDSKIVYIAGNHEVRLPFTITTHLLAAHQLLAMAGQFSMPTLDLPTLLDLEGLGVECMANYPEAETFVGPARCTHGNVVRSRSPKTMDAILQKANDSTIIGVLLMLYREDAWVGVAMTFFAVLAIIAMMRLRTIGVPRWLAVRQKSAEAFGFLGEVLNGTKDIRANGAVNYILERFDTILGSWLRLRRRASMGFSLIWTTRLLLFALGTCVSFGAGYLL